MPKVAFIVDGFNLYHSLKASSKLCGGVGTKWLDLRSLCSSYFPQLGPGKVELSGIYYFSALATHIAVTSPDVVKRHKAYIKCLEDDGIHVEMSRFKEKIINCNNCGTNITRHEEKETDVAIAVKLIELLHMKSCDIVILVTGDTDISPAVRLANTLFSHAKVGFAFPWGRQNNQLESISDVSWKLSLKSYLRYQFPDPYKCADGTLIAKPVTW